eukprot:gene3639-7255_t
MENTPKVSRKRARGDSACASLGRNNNHKLRNLSCKVCNETNMTASQFSQAQLNKALYKDLATTDLKCKVCVQLELEVEEKNSKRLKMKNSKKGNSDNVIKIIGTHPIDTPSLPLKSLDLDPSTLYLKNPLKAPLVRECKAFFQDLGLRIQVHIGPKMGWRTVAKMAVRASQDKVDGWSPIKIGLFKPGSHQVVECSNSPVHHPSINRCILEVERVCNLCHIIAYDEATGTGQLRYLLLAVERSTGKVQLTLVWNDTPTSTTTSTPTDSTITADSQKTAALDRLTGYLSSNLGGVSSSESSMLLHSLWVHFHSPVNKHVNAITGRGEDSWRRIFGPDVVLEQIDVRHSPNNDNHTPVSEVTRANIDSFANIVRSIRDWLLRPDGSSSRSECVELYGGVGTIGLNCLDLLSSLHCSDENPHNKACFDASLATLPKNLSERAVYQSASASTVARSGGLVDCDVLIVDPPRKGLDEEVLEALLSTDMWQTTTIVPTTVTTTKGGDGRKGSSTSSRKEECRRLLIYVSCGFKAFRRDAQRLLMGTSTPSCSCSSSSPGSRSRSRRYCEEEDVSVVTSNTHTDGDTMESIVSNNNNHNNNNSSNSRLLCWKLLHAEGHVLFPGADHIETLAVFEQC